VEKNEDLQTALDSLKIVNMKIEDLNRNLEQKVNDRTKELQIKNERLVQYAFMNAHMLRGPLCRIKGLSLLRKMASTNDSDREVIEDMMEKSIDELDKITTDIQGVIATNEQSLP
jgi:light-regulated signal transduction histidine kinase (bacteriophytochrome)